MNKSSNQTDTEQEDNWGMRQYNSYHSGMAAYLMDISPSHSLEERLSNMREQMVYMR